MAAFYSIRAKTQFRPCLTEVEDNLASAVIAASADQNKQGVRWDQNRI
ncbi:hypothetical protein [Labrys okinawensis]|nr:hypothetical protein [Labrys okinawensis]